MDIREQLYHMDRFKHTELDYIPAWARAEHMQQSVPLKELCSYGKEAEPGTGYLKKLLMKLQAVRAAKESVVRTGKESTGTNCTEQKERTVNRYGRNQHRTASAQAIL